MITGLRDPLQQAERFRDAGAKTVVITQGERGSLLVSDKLRLRAGVYPIEFVGGAGSGDAFDAGYIAGLLAGEDPAGCLRWGSALGASCVRAIGATESVFNRDEAEAFLREHTLAIGEVLAPITQSVPEAQDHFVETALGWPCRGVPEGGAGCKPVPPCG